MAMFYVRINSLTNYISQIEPQDTFNDDVSSHLSIFVEMNKFNLALFLFYGMNFNSFSQSTITFFRSKSLLNYADAPSLMTYDPVDNTTKLLLKGTEKGRGEYNAVTSPDISKIVFNTYPFSSWKLGIADIRINVISEISSY